MQNYLFSLRWVHNDFFLVDEPYFQFVPEIVIYKEIFTSSSTMDMEKSKL